MRGREKMENTLYIALSRQSAIRREMSVIANNIANMNTTAYKGEKMMFVDHLVKSKGGDRLISEKLAFVRDIAQYQDFSEGSIVETHNDLDVALHGDGFFVLETERGTRYTRNGRFQLNEEGKLINADGHAVLSDAGQPFFFTPNESVIDIGKDGTISTQNGPIGKLDIVSFENRQRLQKEPGGLYVGGGEATPMEEPHVVQGALEGSNVNPMIEMTKMIESQRAYSSIKSFIEKEDQRIQKLNQLMAR